MVAAHRAFDAVGKKERLQTGVCSREPIALDKICTQGCTVTAPVPASGQPAPLYGGQKIVYAPVSMTPAWRTAPSRLMGTG